MVTVAATGHRPDKLRGLDEYRIVAACRAFLEHLQPERAISGMAVGFDTLFARAALSLDIPLVAAVPGEPGQQPSRWPVEAQREHRELIARAVEVVHITNGPTYARQCNLRNEWMVDRAHVMLALWDGSGGGTGNCVAYADRRGVPVVNLWALLADVPGAAADAPG